MHWITCLKLQLVWEQLMSAVDASMIQISSPNSL